MLLERRGPLRSLDPRLPATRHPLVSYSRLRRVLAAAANPAGREGRATHKRWMGTSQRASFFAVHRGGSSRVLYPIEGRTWCPPSPPREINEDWIRSVLDASKRCCQRLRGTEINVLPITRRPRCNQCQIYRTGAQKVHFFQAMVSIGDGARPAWSTRLARVNGASCPSCLQACLRAVRANPPSRPPLPPSHACHKKKPCMEGSHGVSGSPGT